jgi:histidinol-phosphate aminotransferase
VLAAIAAHTNDSLRLYPDPTALVLRQAIAKRFGLTPEHVFVGNGSDEVLGHAFHALLKQDSPVWFPDITYSFYPVYCGLYQIKFRAIPLDERFKVLVNDYLPDAVVQVALDSVGGVANRSAAASPRASVAERAGVDLNFPRNR